MNIKIGDKLIVTKKMPGFFDEGTIIEVAYVEDDMVSFTYGENNQNHGFMDFATCEEHFEKVVKNTTKNATASITLEHVEAIMSASEIDIQTVFDKCTIVTCKLPNGFVIVEYSACVSPNNYNEQTGVNICLDKIINKVWELEAYKLQDELYLNDAENYCNGNCDDCPYSEDEYVVSDGCLDTDLDCDDCKDHECPFNPNI